jgi:hypothetical protein
MTEKQLKQQGFQLSDAYPHDQYVSIRYVLGVMEVEFTYEGIHLVSCDLTIAEVNSKPVTLEDIKALVPILGKWTE